MRRKKGLLRIHCPTLQDSTFRPFTCLRIENCAIALSEFDQFDEIQQALFRECALQQVELEPTGTSMTRRAAEV